MVNAKDNEGNTPLFSCGSKKVNCRNFFTLLCHGSNANISNESGFYPSLFCTCARRNPCEVRIYFEKLKLLGFEINDCTLKSYNKTASEKFNEDMENKVSLFKKEIESLKEIVLTWNDEQQVTLYDVMFMNKSKVVDFLNNEKLAKVYQDSGRDFEKKFEFYGFILNRHYREASKQQNLIQSAAQSLRHLSKKVITDICIEKIFMYFNNFELKVLADKPEPARFPFEM